MKRILFLIALTFTTMANAQQVKQTAGRNQLGDFAPKFAELNDDVLFGEVWSRTDQLSLELLTLCLQRDKVRKKIDKMKTPRVYEKSFKENAVRLCEYSPIVQVARELGINESMLRRWIKECFLLSLFPSRGQSQGRVRTNVEPTGFHFLL